MLLLKIDVLWVRILGLMALCNLLVHGMYLLYNKLKIFFDHMTTKRGAALNKHPNHISVSHATSS